MNNCSQLYFCAWNGIIIKYFGKIGFFKTLGLFSIKLWQYLFISISVITLMSEKPQQVFVVY
jgi:hypothetical protein